MIITFKAGQQFNQFYGNGEFSGLITVTRVSDKSVFVRLNNSPESREGMNTAKNYIVKGLWKELPA